MREWDEEERFPPVFYYIWAVSLRRIDHGLRPPLPVEFY